jgi:hypothetical protein
MLELKNLKLEPLRIVVLTRWMEIEKYSQWAAG